MKISIVSPEFWLGLSIRRMEVDHFAVYARMSIMDHTKYVTYFTVVGAITILSIGPGYYRANDAANLKLDSVKYVRPIACNVSYVDPLAQLGYLSTEVNSDAFNTAVFS